MLRKIVLVVFVLAAFVFAFGPRPGSNDTVTFEASQMGDNLDAYLAASEANIANLKPGAAKEIIWADTTAKAKTPISIVYLHGFSASKHEIRPVPDQVAKALGANLYFARFQGHGRDGDGMAEASVQGWANDFAEAIAIGARIGGKVLVMATSNGGMVGAWGLAKPEFSKNIAGIVYVSPNFELHGISTELANIPWAETILPLVAGRQRTWEPRSELHEKWWTYSYPTRAVFPVTAMLKRVKEIDFSKVETPALFFYSPKDKVVVAEETEKVIQAWGGPTEAVKVESPQDESAHVIMGDALSPEYNEKAVEKIITWVRGLGL